MASNPLLALLNFSGGGSSPAATAPPANGATKEQAKPKQLSLDGATFSSSNASSDAANSLLQSLLSPSLAATPRSNVSDGRSEIGQGAVSPAARDSAAELLALLSPTQATTPSKNISQAILSPPAPAQANSAISPVPTFFDQASPFDLLAQPSSGMPKKENGAVQQSRQQAPSAAATPARKPAARPAAKQATPVKSTSILQKAPVTPSNATAAEYVSDPNLRALRHLIGLRASSGFDEEDSSGLKEQITRNGKTYTMDLLAAQPAGPSTLYPAKLEIQPITILKSAQSELPEGHTGTTAPRRAIWQWNTVVSTCESLVCYVTAKSKVRIIDQYTGERAMAIADGAVRSLFVNLIGKKRRHALLLGVMTDRSIGIWSIGKNFGSDEQSTKLVAYLTIGNASSATFVHACFSRTTSSSSEQVIVVRSDGSAAAFSLSALHVQAKATWEGSTKTVISQRDNEEKSLVALSQSSSGSLLAAVYASSDVKSPFSARLISLSDPASSTTIALNGLPEISKIDDVSFSALVGASKGNGTRALLLGFNRNSTFAFVDLAQGIFRQTYHLAARGKTQYNLALWHHGTSTLLAFNSLRSSLLTLRPYSADVQKLPTISSTNEHDGHTLLRAERGQTLDEGILDINRVETKDLKWAPIDKVHPVLKECALPEVWISFSVDDGEDSTSLSLRIAAFHSGGIQTMVLPEEASRQQYGHQDDEQATVHAPEKSSSLAPVQVKKENDSQAQSKAKTEKADTFNSRASAKAKPVHLNRHAEDHSGAKSAAVSNGMDADAMRALLTDLERNILSSISTIPGGLSSAGSTKAAAAGIDSTSNTSVPSASVDELSQSVIRQLIPALREQLDDAFRRELAQNVADIVSQALPTELQSLLMRPDLNAHLTRTITATIVPAVQRTAMEVVTRAMAPHFEEVVSGLATKVEAAVEQGMTSIRKDVVTEQSKALLESEAAIRDLARQMGQMTSMMEGLSRQNAKLERALNEVREEQKVISLNSTRSQNGAADHSSIPSSSTPFSRAPTSQPVVPAPAPTQDSRDVEDTLIAALTNDAIDRDATPLQSALTRLSSSYGNAFAAIRSPQGQLRVSQAVNLALLHRLVKTLQRFVQDGPTTAASLAPEQSVPWIEAACAACVRTDVQIAQAYDNIRGELFETLVQTHLSLSMSHRTPWWTRERFTDATMRYLQ